MHGGRGSLFVISAPSGAGKTSLCKRLCEVVPRLRLSVSYTTRLPRPGETQDVHYTFVDEDEFRTMIAEDEFIEWAQVHGNFYGTSGKRIEDLIASGFDVLLDIDVQGAIQVRHRFPEGVLIFIFPPSVAELVRRLEGRMTDSREVIERRLKNARDEVRQYSQYDYAIVNDDFDEALCVLRSVIVAERARVRRLDHTRIHEEFFKEA